MSGGSSATGGAVHGMAMSGNSGRVAPAAFVAPADEPPSAATVTIGKNAMYKGYQTKSITLAKGGTLSVVNLDNMEHTVTADEKDARGNPLFDTWVGAGQTATISAASNLAPGTYHFHCLFHPTTMRGTLTISGSGGGVQPTPQTFDQPLQLPRVLTGSHIRIPVSQKKVRVLPKGPLTRMWTFAGSYPGPTIRRPVGKDTKVTFVNRLPKRVGSITIHFHGDHHAARYDGQPTRYLIRHGHSRTYDYPLTDSGRAEPAAFDFYHDHRMGWTSRDNWNGLQGMFITDSKAERKLELPSGRYDLPLMVSERSFTRTNQLTEPFPKHPAPMAMKGPMAPPDDATVGTHILVDGRYAPYQRVTQHRYRLRLLNSSPFTSYDFVLSDGRPFVQVGTGDGLLPHPVVRQDIELGPAQRADVVVDFHGEAGKKVELETVPRINAPPRGVGTPSAQLMQFRVGSGSARDTSKVPSSLLRLHRPRTPAKVTAHWTVGLGGNSTTGTYWTLDGKPFNPHRVDLTVPLGATEKWVLHNASGMTHYVHLHEEQWYTVKRDGKRPPPWERGLEDTWLLDPGETVVVVAKFTDYTGVFMVHCHMLDHEDHGLMAQWAVVGTNKRLPRGYWYSGLAAGSR